MGQMTIQMVLLHVYMYMYITSCLCSVQRDVFTYYVHDVYIDTLIYMYMCTVLYMYKYSPCTCIHMYMHVHVHVHICTVSTEKKWTNQNVNYGPTETLILQLK